MLLRWESNSSAFRLSLSLSLSRSLSPCCRAASWLDLWRHEFRTTAPSIAASEAPAADDRQTGSLGEEEGIKFTDCVVAT